MSVAVVVRWCRYDRRSLFAWSATSILVIFIINKNRVLFVGLLGLMASGINDQDLVSEARRFFEWQLWLGC